MAYLNTDAGAAREGIAVLGDEASLLSGLTASAAEMNKVDGISATGALVVSETRTFTETTGAGTYTGSVAVPAGANVIDIIIQSTALWTATTSATMTVGDSDADGWYTGVDLKATDLLVGEDLSFAHAGGKAGVYLAAEARTRYSESAQTIAGVVVTVGAAGNAGRTRMTVVYEMATPVAATKA